MTQTNIGTTPREVTPQEIGWLAGILDGEGSIAFGKTYNKGTTKRGYNYYHGIHIVNTNEEMIRKASDIIFTLCQYEPKQSKMSRISRKIYKDGLVKASKPCYEICLRNMSWTKLVLNTLIPHLTEKRRRAEALVHAIERMQELGKEKSGVKKFSYYTDELDKELMELWENARRD